MTYSLHGTPSVIVDNENYRRYVVNLMRNETPVCTVDVGCSTVVFKLNQKGYLTAFSCSGLLRDHWVYDDHVDEAYLQYVIDNAKVERDEAIQRILGNVFHRSPYIWFEQQHDFALPHGWYWREKGIYFPERPEREKLAAWAELEAIVKALPELT